MTQRQCRDMWLCQKNVKRSKMSGPSSSLSIPFPAGAAAEAAPVSPESALPCSPILTTLNPAIGMTQVGTADPPEEGEGAEAREQRDPDSDTFIVGSRGRSDTDVLAVGSQRHDCPIQSLPKMAQFNGGMQVFAPDLAHDGRRDDRQHLSAER